MRILARVFALAAFGVLAVGLVVPATGAQAALGGVTLSSQGVGFQWTFDQPGSPIPATPTFEMEQAYSVADYNSGPTTHALGSLFWPGSAGANFGPVYGAPAYPVRAEAFSPATPHKQDTTYGPNTTMHASAGPTDAKSSTVWQNESQAAQAIATGDFASTADTLVQGNQAISQATGQASNVTIAGVIHIDSVISSAKAVTNGKNGVVSGTTKVSGVSVQGQAVTVDDKGVHAGGQTVPVLDPINSGSVQQALQQAGITMKVAKPVDTVKGANAQRVLGGLVIEFQPNALSAIVDQLPQQVKDQLKTYIQFDQTMTMSIGGASVGSQTIGGYTVPVPPPPPPPPATHTGGGGGGTTTTTTATGGGGGGPITLPKSNGTAPPTVATVPASLPINIPPMKATSVMLIALSLLAAAGSSRILKVLADRALAARAADRCPLEETS